MKRGDIDKAILNTARQLVAQGKQLTSDSLIEYSGYNKRQIYSACHRMKSKGTLKAIGRGIFELVTDQCELPLEQSEQSISDENRIYKLLDVLNTLPDLVVEAFDAIIDLTIEPEVEIMNMVARRNERITNLEVLLSKSKIDASNMRAKISELQNNLNKLQSQKNRVIPEDKIIIRNH